MEYAKINKQAKSKPRQQFEQGLADSTVVVEAVISAMGNYQTMDKKVFQDHAAMERFKALLVDHVYDRVNAQP